jgi:hypothetical protein
MSYPVTPMGQVLAPSTIDLANLPHSAPGGDHTAVGSSMQKPQIQFLCQGVVIRTPWRENRCDALPGQGFPPWLREKAGKTPPPDQGASGTPAKGLHTTGGDKQGNRGCVGNGTGCILLAHPCPLPNGRPCCFAIRYRARQLTPKSMAARTLFAMSLGQALLSVPASHRRSSKADCPETSGEPLPAHCRMRFGPGQTVT